MKAYLCVKEPNTSVASKPFVAMLGRKVGNAWEARDLTEAQLETLRASNVFHIRLDDPRRKGEIVTLVVDGRDAVKPSRRRR